MTVAPTTVGGGAGGVSSGGGGGGGGGGNPQFGIILMENAGYSDVYTNGNGPFEVAQADANVLFTNYNAVDHPSLPNYVSLTCGSELGKSGTDNVGTTPGLALPSNIPNIFRQLVAAGFSWKVYAEGFNELGGLYASKHDPGAFYSDTVNSANHTNFTQFMPDIANSALPDFFFVAPNLNNDGHNTTTVIGDNWLKGTDPNSSKFKFPGIAALLNGMRPNGVVCHTMRTALATRSTAL